MERKSGRIEDRLPKSPDVAGVGMPQLHWWEIATGELAQVTGTLGDAVSTRSHIR
jgi:hypothetical protein